MLITAQEFMTAVTVSAFVYMFSLTQILSH